MASHKIRASLAAAAPISLAFGYLYGSALWLLGVVAFLWSGFIAFLVALLAAQPFFAVKPRITQPYYFLLHLSVGYLLGILFASIDARTDTLEELYTSRETTLPLVASLGAWCYLFLYDGTTKQHGLVERMGAGLKLATLLLALVLLAYIPIAKPYIESDSCHNVLRDQRSSNGPIESIRMSLPPDAEPQLKSYYAEFATRHNLESSGHPIHKHSAQTSMCNERVTFKASGFFEGRHFVRVFEMVPNSEWQTLAEELVCDIEQIWPGSIQLSDRDDGDDTAKLAARCLADP